MPRFFISTATTGLSIGVLTALVLFYTNISAYAAATFGLNKAVVEVSVKQYQVHVGTIYAINMSAKDMEAEIQLENWLKREGYDNELSKIEPAAWLKFKPAEFELPAKSNKPINYIIEIPEGLEGELIAMAYFAPKIKASSVSLGRRIGIAVYASAKEKQQVSCKINLIYINKQKGYSFIQLVVENTGNVHVRPEGTVEVLRAGKKVDSLAIEKGMPVYPGKTEVFSKKLNELKPGKYTVQAQMNYGEIYGLSKVCVSEPVIMEIEDAETD
ncbi:hypothetical protein ACFLTD_03945 [Elusimicrobiota bacterium]